LYKLSNEILLDSYKKALKLKVDKDFIFLLKQEIENREKKGLLKTESLYEFEIMI
jgi:hypothetical protein